MEKQIKEMARIYEFACDETEVCTRKCGPCHATLLYNAGYRKQVEAEWVKQDKKTPIASEAICSNCGRDVVYQVVDNRWQFENYCPHCGACMTRGKTNE